MSVSPVSGGLCSLTGIRTTCSATSASVVLSCLANNASQGGTWHTTGNCPPGTSCAITPSPDGSFTPTCLPVLSAAPNALAPRALSDLAPSQIGDTCSPGSYTCNLGMTAVLVCSADGVFVEQMNACNRWCGMVCGEPFCDADMGQQWVCGAGGAVPAAAVTTCAPTTTSWCETTTKTTECPSTTTTCPTTTPSCSPTTTSCPPTTPTCPPTTTSCPSATTTCPPSTTTTVTTTTSTTEATDTETETETESVTETETEPWYPPTTTPSPLITTATSIITTVSTPATGTATAGGGGGGPVIVILPPVVVVGGGGGGGATSPATSTTPYVTPPYSHGSRNPSAPSLTQVLVAAALHLMIYIVV